MQRCVLAVQSYAKRTVVDGFDPMFNAITGLNGSGKSNILDSICFVLGISRLEQVPPPAASPPDLSILPGHDQEFTVEILPRSERAPCRSWFTSRARRV